jgi:hypothetical protein
MRKKNPKPVTTQRKSEVSKTIPKPETEPESVFMEAEELAKMINVTLRWLEQNRHRIIGAQRVGGMWKYHKGKICMAIASGKNIVLDNKKIS